MWRINYELRITNYDKQLRMLKISKYLQKFLISAVFVLFFPCLLLSETKTFELSFSLQDFKFEEKGDYIEIAAPGLEYNYFTEPGMPALPWKGVKLLVPRGAALVSVNYTVDKNLYDSEINLLPMQPFVRVQDIGAVKPEFVPPDKEIYASSLPWPKKQVEFAARNILREYEYFAFNICPFVYYPAEKKLEFIQNIKVTVEYEPASGVSYKKNKSPLFRDMIRSTVINPQDVPPLEKEEKFRSDKTFALSTDIEYVIITSNALSSYFQPLADWKTQKGVPAEVVTTEYIYSNYSGATNQLKIKNFLYYYYQNKNLVYVLLGGDNTVVPDQDCRIEYYGSYPDNYCPTDLFYACFDNTFNWNADGDGVAGETSDGCDYDPELIISRAPVRSSAHTEAFVNKSINYEKNPPQSNFAKKMLISGEQLWNTWDGRSDADWRGERMWTDYIQPYWSGTHSRFYDTNTDFGGAGYDLSPTNLSSQLNSGWNYYFIATHGGTSIWAMESGGYYYSSHAQSLTNSDRQGIVVTIACLSNRFDGETAMSEGFIRNGGGGAVAYHGSSRYGWGYSSKSSSLGPSYKLSAYFFKHLFTGQPSSDSYKFGSVATLAKLEYINYCSSYNTQRWLTFALNHIGDPELDLLTDDPSVMTASHSGTLSVGTQLVYIDNINASEAAASFYCDGVFYGKTVISGGSGNLSLDAPIPENVSSSILTITAHNYKPYISEITIEDDEPPANDNPADAFTIVPVVDNCSGFMYSNENATDSQTLPAPDCGSYIGEDVWFKFSAPPTGEITIEASAVQDGISDGALAVYSGSSPSFTQIACDDNSGSGSMPKVSLTGLNPGETYYIRFWAVNAAENGNFNICGYFSQPYSSLPYSTGFESGIDYFWQTVSDNANGKVTASSSNTPFAGNRHLVMEALESDISVINYGTLHLDLNGAEGAYLKFSFKEFGSISFDEDGVFISDDGGQSYVKIFDTAPYEAGVWNTVKLDLKKLILDNGLTMSSNFILKFQSRDMYPVSTEGYCFDEINVQEEPFNDDPCDAVEIQGSLTCDPIVFSNAGAAHTYGILTPDCGSYNENDVWFSTLVPDGGTVNIEARQTNGGSLDGAFMIYSGSCDDLTPIACDDNSGENNMPSLTLQRTPGERLYIRFWTNQGSENGMFELCCYGEFFCDAGAMYGCDYKFIENVSLKELNNQSGCSDAYVNYSGMQAPVLYRGLKDYSSYNINVLNGYHSNDDQAGCWIDWNGDLQFDPQTEAVNMTYDNGTHTASGAVEVPLNSVLGENIRMRLRLVYSWEALEPCGDTYYGETEDYSVYIVNAVPEVLSPIGYEVYSSDSPELNWSEIAGADSYNVYVSLSENEFDQFIVWQSSVSGETTLSIPPGELDSDYYFWRVSANTPDGESEYSPLGSFILENCPAELYIPETVISEGQALFKAETTIYAAYETNAFENTAGDVTFAAGQNIVLKPGFKINSGAHFSAVIVENACDYEQTHTEGGFQPAKDLISENENGNEVNSVNDDVEIFRVFPNPSSGIFTVEISDNYFSKLEITDILGRIVLRKDIKNSDRILNFDISNHTSGIYIIKLISQKGVSSKKILIDN